MGIPARFIFFSALPITSDSGVPTGTEMPSMIAAWYVVCFIKSPFSLEIRRSRATVEFGRETATLALGCSNFRAASLGCLTDDPTRGHPSENILTGTSKYSVLGHGRIPRALVGLVRRLVASRPVGLGGSHRLGLYRIGHHGGRQLDVMQVSTRHVQPYENGRRQAEQQCPGFKFHPLAADLHLAGIFVFLEKSIFSHAMSAL